MTSHPLLVIGYGNPLRGDDGFGPRVAEALLDLDLDGLQVISGHQLTLELSETLSEVQAAVFVDASVLPLPGELRREKLVSLPLPRDLSHHLLPGHLLTLAQQLYGQAPRAELLTVGVGHLEHGEGLSVEVEAAMEEAIGLIRERWVATV